MVILSSSSLLFFFFFNDTATTEIYTLSLHDALPISSLSAAWGICSAITLKAPAAAEVARTSRRVGDRSEEHTSELQSQSNIVCRLLLEKKKKQTLIDQSHHDQLHYQKFKLHTSDI